MELVQRWRILLRPTELERPQVIDMIKATVVLHNFCCRKSAQGTRLYLPSINPEEEDGDSISFGIRRREEVLDLQQVNFGSNFYGKVGKRIRDLFCEYFNSAVGAVPWQNSKTFATSGKRS